MKFNEEEKIIIKEIMIRTLITNHILEEKEKGKKETYIPMDNFVKRIDDTYDLMFDEEFEERIRQVLFQ